MALTVIAGAISQAMFVENQPMTEAFVRRLVTLVADGLERSSLDY
jgi:hypothetical protein